ncbi:CD74 molecule, major histocompatibility complex, class II invariant chain b isoform X2 [Pimephales promelas]|uniref:CD74 molecule, major histocompatibility complex, class II invariant chain b isoform X2 n=1 Tax=Pimephales promelas TaxID=90988 RepID=UPI001955776D|nr:CD74 molecule, major histocompatibility complex, class II invariant chain b isoform X2 [Pimephales promelas]KAG1940346.1 CD74 molecule, major histocompatibility complex, class II invariant chain b [Pimephales promelas]
MSTDGTEGPLLRAQSEQTTINMGPRGGSNSRALKVAGVTLLAGILIAGQAFTAYMSYNHREQLNTLERRNDRLHELSRKFVMRSQGVPMKMQLPMSSLALTLEDSPKDKDSPSSSPKPEPSVLSQCLKEAAGVVKSPLPSFRPRCDENGDYQLKQCWDETKWCWCVDKSGVQIPDSMTEGPLQCSADADTTVMEPLVGKDGH